MSVPSPKARRLAGLGAALSLAVAALLASPVAASAAPTPADHATLGPGVQISTPVGRGHEYCTANFLFRAGAGGAVYLGTAAHCTAGPSASTSVDGCDEPVLPLRTRVAIRGRDGATHAGTLAYNSWNAMQAAHESDPLLCTQNDFALIALDPSDVPSADPTVPGFGGPTALDTDGTANGERVVSYQPNQASATPFKQGTSHGQPQGPRTHVVTTVPPAAPGDSGSGYLDARGRAFGVLSSLMTPTATNGVTDIARALDYAAGHGGVGRVALVPGGTSPKIAGWGAEPPRGVASAPRPAITAMRCSSPRAGRDAPPDRVPVSTRAPSPRHPPHPERDATGMAARHRELVDDTRDPAVRRQTSSTPQPRGVPACP